MHDNHCSQGKTTSLSVPLLLDISCPSPAHPVTIGIPFPRGLLTQSAALILKDAASKSVPIQTEPLARWPDGSIRWLLIDFVAWNLQPGQQIWHLETADRALEAVQDGFHLAAENNSFLVDTGKASFRFGKTTGQPLLQVTSNGRELLSPKNTRIELTAVNGAIEEPRITQAVAECSGPVRTTIRMEAEFGGRAPCHLTVRACNYTATGLVRLQLTIHNPRRARHRGGIWDLGDSGSIFFRDLSVSLGFRDSDRFQVRFSETPGQPWREAGSRKFEIYQDSSGGENWRSRNHLNHAGKVPCTFRGYRVETGAGCSAGMRANPVVRLKDADFAVAVAIPEFWQQFPKAIETNEGAIRLRLFPAQFGDAFELQGGEQKTHDLWIDFGPSDSPDHVLDWVHQPVDVRLTPEWYAASGAFPEMVPVQADHADQFESYLAGVIEGPKNLFARREVIDEFGWRNFGDIYADHENAFYAGEKPVVSHYNNQFDPLMGAILQYARTRDQRWRHLFEPLARHVIDIDIYHTDQDRAAYCGGLFWMTDHYLDAITSTHRTYSKGNRRRGQAYGGGPGCEHNFTTGLLCYHYLTGDPLARDAVLSLANWVIRMDDGCLNSLSIIDAGPTGLASCTTATDYHGPGRGAGLSINSQLDAWLLTGQRDYLDKAEQLIRRCIHPADDIESLDLPNAELRWSYAVFLVSLAKYLRIKVDMNELDARYGYARASLLHYASWMLANERPFLQRRGELEYPTETWAAQDLRKANAMRLASEHAEEPLRQQLLDRATELADGAWQDLLSFENPHTTRAIAVLLTEGTRDQYCRANVNPRLPPPIAHIEDFGCPSKFVNQRQRVLRLLRSPSKLLPHAVGSVRRLFKLRHRDKTPPMRISLDSPNM